MSFVVSIRIPDREAWERVKSYARREGISFGKLVIKALEFYISREDRVLEELRELRREIFDLLGGSLYVKLDRKEVSVEISSTSKIPDFVRENPWAEIISKKGKIDEK